ncbi:protease Do-like 10, mitochondrial [Iris pallida]|uniref:Protease Do-like 10, mitochondrial n=1 Tax=Iris pallida TaxID=29817 RepID=A0AAX6HW18_IRIPA|nr:protease Do-like 10, mitochondrial [Iris pallida]
MMTAGVVHVAIEKGVDAQPSIRSRPHTLPCAGGTFHSFVAAGGGYRGEGDGRRKEPCAQFLSFSPFFFLKFKI